MTDAPRLRVVEAEAFERSVFFRFPFRFGAAEVSAAPQAFVRVVVEDAQGHRATGWAAEMMMPRWFDKAPDLSVTQNVEQLRQSLRLGLRQIVQTAPDSCFGLHAQAQPAQYEACAAAGLNGLIASFGLALPDRAVLDAFCRLLDLPAVALMRANLAGLDARTTPDLAGFDLATFLARLPAPDSIGARHTVGLGDPLVCGEIAAPVDDGLPQSLDQVIDTYRHRHFKLKLSGEPEADLARLRGIVAVIDARVPDYVATLDGNEQYRDLATLAELLDGLDRDPALAGLRRRLLFIEQPIARSTAFEVDVSVLGARVAFEIDESDSSPDAFLHAQALGYTGVSSKSCKGVYRALLNAARVAQGARRGLFLSAEDLTVQPGLALQQDLTLAAITGNAHVERNGHHFAGGMQQAPAAEQGRFLAAHPDLYDNAGGAARLRIHDGRIALCSTLAAAGLGCAINPDPAGLRPLQSEEAA